MVKGLIRTFERIERQKAARHDFADVPIKDTPTEGKRLLVENPMSDILRKQYHVKTAQVLSMDEKTGFGTARVESNGEIRQIHCADQVGVGDYIDILYADDAEGFMDRLRILGLTRSDLIPVREEE